MLYVCLEAVASPTKLSCTQRTRVNFQRLFMMMAVPLFLPTWFVRLQSESGVLMFWKYILFILFQKLKYCLVVLLDVLVIGHFGFSKFEKLLILLK